MNSEASGSASSSASPFAPMTPEEVTAAAQALSARLRRAKENGLTQFGEIFGTEVGYIAGEDGEGYDIPHHNGGAPGQKDTKSALARIKPAPKPERRAAGRPTSWVNTITDKTR